MSLDAFGLAHSESKQNFYRYEQTNVRKDCHALINYVNCPLKCNETMKFFVEERTGYLS